MELEELNLASGSRVHCSQGKSRKLSRIWIRKYVSLKVKGKVYMICVRSAMVYGS